MTAPQPERRETPSRRLPENIMGRRQSDKFDIGEWMRTHYIDPVITAALSESEERFEKKVKAAVAEAVQVISAKMDQRDESTDWRTVRIAGLMTLLLFGLLWVATKLWAAM